MTITITLTLNPNPNPNPDPNAVAQAAVAAVVAQLTGGGAGHGTQRAGDNHGTEPRPVQHAWATPAREGVINTGRAAAREGARPRQAHPSPNTLSLTP